MKLLYVLSTVIIAVKGQPYEGFPFSKQLPPVGRVDELFSFQFSADTYESSQGKVVYSAEGLPEWLSLDADSRTLSGTPSSKDVSSDISFVLIGNDSNSEFRKTQKLVVSSAKGPKPSTEFTVLSQLAQYGRTDGKNALVLSPGQTFNVTFDAKTFVSDDEIVANYGTSSDHTPLPNWLFFDPSDLRFSGVAPAVNSKIAPGFAYDFNFIATDYAGFTGSFVNFNIIIGAHSLTTSLKSTIHINGTSDDEINFDLPLKSVYFDDTVVTADQISRVELNGNPDWLSLSNFTLKGKIPNDYNESKPFNVSIFDNYFNSVTLFFEIEQIDSLFAVNSFKTTNATRNEYFQYYFLPTDFTDYSNTNVSVDFDSNGDWMEFHDGNLTINGLTPDNFEESEITVVATSGSSNNKMSFKIYGVDAVDKSSSSSSYSSSTSSSLSSSSSIAPSSVSETVAPTTTQEPTSTPIAANQKPPDSNKKAIAIGLGVGIPVLALIVASIVLFLCCARKRKANRSNDKEVGPSPTPKISKPILGNPANGQHNMISSTAFDNSSVDSSFDNEKSAEATRLGALNALKLDENDYYSDHGSSLTNVGSLESIHDEDTKSSLYHDAVQSQSSDMLLRDGKTSDLDNYYQQQQQQQQQQQSSMPKKSWRQTIDSQINRESLNSLATVSTNELLSIRLAEDDDIHKDPRKSSLNFRDSAFLGTSASTILTRDDSGNIQRLDSDGNVVASLKDTRQRASRATDLDILAEEDNTLSPLGALHDREGSFTSSSTGDAFIAVSDSNGDVKWQQHPVGSDRSQYADDANRDNELKARLRTFTNRGRADASNDTTQSTYETAEVESL